MSNNLRAAVPASPSISHSASGTNMNYSLSSWPLISTTVPMSSNSDLEYLKEMHQSIHDILFYYSSFVVLTGIVFNLLNFACFYRMKKRNSQNIYLGALSLADFFNIIMNLLVPMVLHDRRVESWLRDNILTANAWCILYGYLTEVCLLMPVWIMVVLAAERFLSIMWPFRKNVFSTRRHAKLTLAFVSCVIFVWSLYKLATPGVEVHSTFITEYPTPLREICNRPINVSLVNFSTVLWAIVPEFLTLLLNLLIVKRIKTTTDPQKHFYPSERSKRITQATRVVLLLSIIFIASNSPTGVLIIIDLIIRSGQASPSLSGKDLVATMQQELVFMIARKIVLMFYETNLILSFPVYIFTIKNFKTTLRSFRPSSRLFGGRRDSTKIGSKKKDNGFPNPPPPTYNIRPNQIRSTINLKRHLKNNAESECLLFMKNNKKEASPKAQPRQSLLLNNNNNESSIEYSNKENVEMNNKNESSSSRLRSMRFNKSGESNDSSSHSLLNQQQTVINNSTPPPITNTESFKFDKNCPACNPRLVSNKSFISKSCHSNYSIYNYHKYNSHSVVNGFMSEMEESMPDESVTGAAAAAANVKKRIFSDYICNNNSRFYSNLLSFELNSANSSRKRAKKLGRQFKINGPGKLRLQQRVSNGF